jgi:hypothetical protein
LVSVFHALATSFVNTVLPALTEFFGVTMKLLTRTLNDVGGVIDSFTTFLSKGPIGWAGDAIKTGQQIFNGIVGGDKSGGNGGKGSTGNVTNNYNVSNVNQTNFADLPPFALGSLYLIGGN